MHHCEKPWVSSFPLVPTEERTREVQVTLGQKQEDQDPVLLLTLMHFSGKEHATLPVQFKRSNTTAAMLPKSRSCDTRALPEKVTWCKH